MPQSVFLDTNILVYSRDEGSPFFDKVVEALRGLMNGGAVLSIHRQVLREYACVATRPPPRGLGASTERALAEIAEFEAVYRVLTDPDEVWSEWRRLAQMGEFKGSRLHDVYIAAVMLGHGISHILTLNVEDFQNISGLKPFKPEVWQDISKII
jgi:predicted nucleic acid-binding protein